MRHPFALGLYAALPGGQGQTHTLDIDPDLVQLRFTTGVGGFGTLQVGLRDRRWEARGPALGLLPQAVEYRELGHVVLRHGSFVCHEGRMLKAGPAPAGLVRGFQSVGYGLHATKDSWYSSPAGVGATPISAGTLLRQVLAQAAPLLAVENIGDSGMQIAPDRVDGMSPAQVIEHLGKSGTGSSTDAIPMDWAVWDGRRATWLPRSVPGDIQYKVDFDGTVDWPRDATDLYGAVAVRYTAPGVTTGGAVTAVSVTAGGSGYTSAPAVSFVGGGGGGAAATATLGAGVVTGVTVTAGGNSYSSPPAVALSGGGGTGAAAWATVSTLVTSTQQRDTPLASNPAVLTTYGVSRATLLQGGTMDDAQALQFRDLMLALLSAPKVAVTIRRRGRGLERPGGIPVEPWRPRFGEWVRVGDQPPVMILSTDYDAMNEDLTVVCQYYPVNALRDVLAELQRVAANVAFRLNPVSGARA